MLTFSQILDFKQEARKNLRKIKRLDLCREDMKDVVRTLNKFRPIPEDLISKVDSAEIGENFGTLFGMTLSFAHRSGFVYNIPIKHI